MINNAGATEVARVPAPPIAQPRMVQPDGGVTEVSRGCPHLQSLKFRVEDHDLGATEVSMMPTPSIARLQVLQDHIRRHDGVSGDAPPIVNLGCNKITDGGVMKCHEDARTSNRSTSGATRSRTAA